MACYHAWGITKCFKSLRGLLRNHQATWSFIIALTNRLLARGMRWGGERGLLFKPWKEPKFTELNNGSAESAEPRGWKGLIRARNVSSEQTPEQRGQATGLAGSSLSQPRGTQDLSPGQAGTHSLAVPWALSPVTLQDSPSPTPSIASYSLVISGFLPTTSFSFGYPQDPARFAVLGHFSSIFGVGCWFNLDKHHRPSRSNIPSNSEMMLLISKCFVLLLPKSNSSLLANFI